MPRIAYQDQRFRKDSLVVIERAIAICEEYRAAGYEMTLRQVYYQFVARGWLPNSDKSYKRLGGLVNDARLAGLMDWNHISDRTRNIRGVDSSWGDPGEFMENMASAYSRELWTETGQDYRPEVWVEKDALIGVVGAACRPLHVPHFSCRGYVSQSEMWVAGRRMRDHYLRGVTPVVIHLGDHDPSGMDMTRDVTERLAMFAERHVQVIRIALNMDQIEQYEPPPNPAKLTDSRAEGYIEEYGDESWELDALEPQVLRDLITDALEPFIDTEAWEEGEERVRGEREQMGRIAERWDDLDSRWPDVEDLLDA